MSFSERDGEGLRGKAQALHNWKVDRFSCLQQVFVF